MAGERRMRILNRLAEITSPGLVTARLCEVAAQITEVTGAGIMLMSGDMPRGSLCTTNKASDIIEKLQYTLGEGPCVDAYNSNRPVFEPDLADPAAPRWLAFSGPALNAGVRAVFGFPLRVGAIRLGALNLYRDHPGPLTNDQHANALVMADVAAQRILELQGNAVPGELAPELETGADFQYVVHQACGMVAAQLGVSVAQALIRMRAFAFGNDRSLINVSEGVIARTLRFDGGV
mgnify:CR=1 FL=1